MAPPPASRNAAVKQQRGQRWSRSSAVRPMLKLVLVNLFLALACIQLWKYAFQKYNGDGNGATRTTLKKNATTTTLGNPVVHRYSQFKPSLDDGGAWIVQNTTFTRHISTLVEFYEKNDHLCHHDKGKSAATVITVTVSPSFNNSVPAVVVSQMRKNHIGGGIPYKMAFDKYMLFHSGTSSADRVLPSGNVTFAISNADADDDNDDDESSSCPRFCNSSPGGRRCVYNFQDVYRWHGNETYPPPLPWSERNPIPVFRGRLWGVSRLTREQMESEHLFESLMNPENVLRNWKEKLRHKRIHLVHFSKQHEELVNAKFCPHGKQIEMWSSNATNGMFRVLPFDPIPEEKYYTEYQSHVVMGGMGAAFRTARIMGQGIAVILQAFPYEEWFVQYMEPYVHYIPLDHDLSNLNETLIWVKDNPSKVYDIAENGKLFFDEYLSYDRMGEFHYELLFRLLLRMEQRGHAIA